MASCDKTAAGKTGDILSCLYINPTKYCNLACRHCWLDPPHKKDLSGVSGEMSMGEIAGIVEEARKYGLNSIKLTGGEPLLREDTGELLDACEAMGIRVIIETNGTLITKTLAARLKKSTLGHISISLDSAIEERHDFFRGRKGAFKSAVEGIKNLADEGISPQVIMSLYRENIESFPEFIALIKELNVRNVKINLISYVGRGRDLEGSGIAPTVEEIIDFYEKLDALKGDYEGFLALDIPMAFRSLKELKSAGCGVCDIKHILGILPDGNISICGIGFVDEELIFGNARGDVSVIGKIWKENDALERIKKQIPSKLEGVCGMCVFKKACLGACRAEAYYNTGSLFAPHWFCQEAYDRGLFPQTRLVPEELRL